MNKYGVENFLFEILEEVSEKDINQKEQEYIRLYNTYGTTGYNATLGGDGQQYLDRDAIIAKYNEIQNASEVSRIFNCSRDSVSDILKANNIPIKNMYDVNKNSYGKAVSQYDLNNNFIQNFISRMDAARWIIKNNYTSTVDVSAVGSKISLVCRGKRQTAFGFKWMERI